jgi:hypothetical protein
MGVDSTFDIEAFRLSGIPPAPRPPLKLPRPARGEKYLSAPIPLAWLSLAASLPGKALAVALAVWFEAGCAKSRTVILGHAAASRFSVGLRATARGLRSLEAAGLVLVERRAGRSPRVTITEARP